VLEVPRDWLPKARLAADNPAEGDDATPVPDNAMVGSLRQTHAIAILPLKLPLVVGAKVTSKLVLSPTSRVRGRSDPLILKPAPVTEA